MDRGNRTTAWLYPNTPRPALIVPSTEDVRAEVLDPLRMTQEQKRRLDGAACARCGRQDGLRPGGMARVLSGPDGTGRLGYPVRVCPDHVHTGGTW
ncbi:hypothetical protein ACM01_14785 [Streptomyces viridochromogenes]|uniref:Uncharacterized protein n=2 Tax=Streptomyces viridochromogenes TaxID=1938 RepID=A0A0J7ZFL6_STRVR|nr:hypothetical protein ACM01_14785 [Streptomyces viridochromogenes]